MSQLVSCGLPYLKGGFCFPFVWSDCLVILNDSFSFFFSGWLKQTLSCSTNSHAAFSLCLLRYRLCGALSSSHCSTLLSSVSILPAVFKRNAFPLKPLPPQPCLAKPGWDSYAYSLGKAAKRVLPLSNPVTFVHPHPSCSSGNRWHQVNALKIRRFFC